MSAHHSPKMEVSAPTPHATPTPHPQPYKCRSVSPPLKKVLPSFGEQEKLSSETIGESQRWSSYLLWWLCIYSGAQTDHYKIWTLKVKFDWQAGRQADRHRHRQTDRQMQTMTIPEGQNWPQVKNKLSYYNFLSRQCIPKYCLHNGGHLVQPSINNVLV